MQKKNLITNWFSLIESNRPIDRYNAIIKLLRRDEDANNLFNSPDVRKKLVELISDHSIRIRSITLLVLQHAQPPLIEAIPRLIESLENDSVNTVRFHAALALGNQKDKRALQALSRTAEDEQESVNIRECSIFSIGEIGDKASLPLLNRLMRNSEWRIRWAVAMALEDIDNTLYRSLLHHLEKDHQLPLDLRKRAESLLR